MRQTICTRNAEALVSDLRGTAQMIRDTINGECILTSVDLLREHYSKLEVWADYFEMKEPFKYVIKKTDNPAT